MLKLCYLSKYNRFVVLISQLNRSFYGLLVDLSLLAGLFRNGGSKVMYIIHSVCTCLSYEFSVYSLISGRNSNVVCSM